MVKLQWDKVGERLYETGTERGVLYVQESTGEYGNGVAWNGLIGVTQSPEGAEETPIHANNKKYLSLMSAEEFNGNISAYTYPDEFAGCDGSKEIATGVRAGQQERQPFGLAYVTLVGNDTEGTSHGEKLHIIYAAKVSPSERAYTTVNDTPEAIEFGWDFTTTPQDVNIEGIKPTAYISVDSTKVDDMKYKALTDKLFGTEEEEPTLPSITEIVTLVGE